MDRDRDAISPKPRSSVKVTYAICHRSRTFRVLIARPGSELIVFCIVVGPMAGCIVRVQ